jgi:DNA-binding LacI/PurR family transcriptional regulator
VNIRDVARRAKVSTATVSRVMSGADTVRPETAAHVRKAIADMAYVPNSSARWLSLGKSRQFGVIISDITNPFFPELIHTFNELALQHKYGTIVAHTSYNPSRMESAIQSMLEQKVEGLAIMTSEMTPHLIRQVSDREIPMVFLDHAQNEKQFSNIVIDYKSGITQAIDHITSLGHKRIAFIAGPQNLGSAVSRHGHFLEVLRARKIAIDAKHMPIGNHRVDGGYVAMQKLLATAKPPTAVLASNDLTAIGAISAIYEAGLQVPRDISVVGFDDIDISSAYNPPLTTVRLSRSEIATRAFFALYSTSSGRPASRGEHMVGTELVVRRSTAPPPG